jgi:hypothetical protein
MFGTFVVFRYFVVVILINFQRMLVVLLSCGAIVVSHTFVRLIAAPIGKHRVNPLLLIWRNGIGRAVTSDCCTSQQIDRVISLRVLLLLVYNNNNSLFA